MVSSNRDTFLDIAMTQAPDGGTLEAAKILAQKLPILQDAPAFASNAEMGERVSIQNSLPTVQTAQLNMGTARSKGSFTQTVDTIAWLDGRSEVDVRMERFKGAAAVANYRRQKDSLFIEALKQAFELMVLYGDANLVAGEFNGLAKRMATLATAITGSQVRSMGTPGGGDSASIYIVDWGRDSAHLIYPKEGTTAGLKVENKGEQPALDASSNTLEVEVTKFDMMMGLTVKDPRHIARLANIDISDALLDAPTQGMMLSTLNLLMASMAEPDGGMNRVLYAHRNIVAAFWNQAINHPSAALQIGTYLGKPMVMIQGYPMRPTDQASNNEATVA